MKILVIDIGGNSVKLLISEATEARKFPSGPTLTPQQMVSGTQKLTEDWKFNAMTVGYPGRVRNNRPSEEPNNLGRGWLNFDFEKAFGVPVKVINDAAMQALGSYRGGVMLFLGLGTGLGTAMVVDGTIVPLELGRLSYKQGTYEDLLGIRGLHRLGITKWRDAVHEVVARFITALELDDVVIGGGNVNKLDKLPPGCRAGDNALAFRGGFMLWEKAGQRKKRTQPKTSRQTSAA
jgi:predicted NBD/HSP70 family sugar kinase